MIPCPDFDLAGTLGSGQVFRWRRESPAGFAGWIGAEAVRVNQRNGFLYREGSSPEAVRRFFCLDADLPAIARQIDVDPVIHAALQEHGGLRVIRQDPWECMVAFILSAYNNIPRLTGMLEQLSQKFGIPQAGLRGGGGCPGRLGRPTGAAGLSLGLARPSPSLRSGSGHRGRSACETPVHPPPPPAGFPRPEVLAKVSERALRNCGLGYRAPYLKVVAERVASGEVDLERLRGMEDEELRRALLDLPGIGEKVVECVMLFAYGRAAAFPVDVWIGRAMRAWYFKRRKVTDRKIRQFARKRFGPCCGWAQQYLYCRIRAEAGFFGPFLVLYQGRVNGE